MKTTNRLCRWYAHNLACLNLTYDGRTYCERHATGERCSYVEGEGDDAERCEDTTMHGSHFCLYHAAVLDGERMEREGK